jgi:hypothetical protein
LLFFVSNWPTVIIDLTLYLFILPCLWVRSGRAFDLYFVSMANANWGHVKMSKEHPKWCSLYDPPKMFLTSKIRSFFILQTHPYNVKKLALQIGGNY